MADWKAMLKDRKFQVGALVAVAAGGFVYLRKRGAGGGSSTPSGPTVAGLNASPAAAGGSFDTTSSDLAGWLGSYSINLQNQLTGYEQQLTTTNEAIKQAAGLGQARVYTVTAADAATGGNAIWNIAHMFGLGGKTVIAANPWYPQTTAGTLKAGQQIIIPALSQ